MAKQPLSGPLSPKNKNAMNTNGLRKPPKFDINRAQLDRDFVPRKEASREDIIMKDDHDLDDHDSDDQEQEEELKDQQQQQQQRQASPKVVEIVEIDTDLAQEQQQPLAPMSPTSRAADVKSQDASPDASFHSANDQDAAVANPDAKDTDNDVEADTDTSFGFTALPPREPLTAKTPGSESWRRFESSKASATSLRVQRIRQHLEKSNDDRSKFSSMIIDNDEDITEAAVIEPKPSLPKVAQRPTAHSPIQHRINALENRQLNSPIKLRRSPSKNNQPVSPSKTGQSLYPSVSPGKSSNTSHTILSATAGAFRRAKMLLFQDDKKEQVPQSPQTPKPAPSHISRLMAPTASSSARGSPTRLYPEIRSPSKIPSPQRQVSATSIRSNNSSSSNEAVQTPRIQRMMNLQSGQAIPGSLPASSLPAPQSRVSRVPVAKAAERFTRRQAEMKAKEKEAREQEERQAEEREKELLEMRELARIERERKEGLLKQAEEERFQKAEEEKRIHAAAEREARELQEAREAKAEKERKERFERNRVERERQEKLRLEKERLEKEAQEQERADRAKRAERAEAARRDRLIRERQERMEREEKGRLLREQQEKERIEMEVMEKEKEKMEQERQEAELLEEARLETIRQAEMDKENLQLSRKRPSGASEEEQPQKVHLSNMRKPLNSASRTSQQSRMSSSQRYSGNNVMDSPLTKAGMRHSLQKKTTISMSACQSKFGKVADGIMFSSETIKLGASSSQSSANGSIVQSVSMSSQTQGMTVSTPSMKRPTPQRPLTSTTTPQQFRSQRGAGAFSSSMSFQAKLFKQPPPAHSHQIEPVTPAPPQAPTTQLPEINSDSEDDEGPSVLRDWANSPELRALLLRQQVMDPDRVFGPMAPLHMEEIFGQAGAARGAKFRARSSSANWSRDQLTQVEREDYTKQMGYE